jgi:hypothetical protein
MLMAVMPFPMRTRRYAQVNALTSVWSHLSFEIAGLLAVRKSFGRKSECEKSKSKKGF